ncbi:MAG TPA: aminopeptidase P family protein [Bacteroidales bacterium]|nr:aminopeptidase P family protein [Bacteroidales bacterium]
MKTITIDKDLFTINRRNFTERLLPDSLAIFHSNDIFPRNGDQTFKFRQQSDLFYLSGIAQENTILLLYPDCPNPDLREVLFITEPTESLATWEGHKYSRKEAQGISGIEKVRWTGQFDTVLTEVMSFAENVYLNAIEYAKFSTSVPYSDLRFAREIREKYPNHTYRRSAPLVYSLRTIKSDEEIRLIREAINLTGKAFERVLKFVRPGVTEYQVEAEITHEFLYEGASGSAYHPIIASGANACTLHYIENSSVCKEGELLLMDFGAEYGHYAADLTRTIPVSGKFTERQKACYDAVLRVLRQASRLLVPGNTIDKVNKEANRLMEGEMTGLGLFSREQTAQQDPEKPLYTKYFMHGVSHFLGLDVHDVGSKFEPFRPGMVFTFEPGLYIREENLGIRLENNYLVTEGEPLDLTAGIPVEAEEIEGMMSATPTG